MQNTLKVYYQVRFFLSPEIICHIIPLTDKNHFQGNCLTNYNSPHNHRKQVVKNKNFKRSSKPFKNEK